MTVTYGVTPEGFLRKTLEVIKLELEEDYRAKMGAGVNLQADTPYGQAIGIHSEREALVWELAEACYQARRPAYATGAAMDTLFALSGVRRLASTRSSVVLLCGGTQGTLIPAGREVSIGGQFKFATLEDALIGVTGEVEVNAESVDYGPIVAIAGSLTTIETAVSGWDTVTNEADATPGRNRETDAAYRVRREQMLRLGGKASLDSIRADVMALAGVSACVVFENTTDLVDADGRPPHSFEALVDGQTDAEIGAVIWGSKPVGIESYGSTDVELEDSQGTTRHVFFTHPEQLHAYIRVLVTWYQAGELGYIDGVTRPWPSTTTEDEIKAAILAYLAANGTGIGVSAYASRLYSPVSSVPGVKDLQVFIGVAVNPTGTSIIATVRQLVSFGSDRITFGAI